MLTQDEQNAIYDSLTEEFRIESQIPLAKMAVYLKKNGYDSQKFGFKKMKDMMKSLPYLDFIQKKSEDGNISEFIIIKNVLQNNAVKGNEKKSPAEPDINKFLQESLVFGATYSIQDVNNILQKANIKKQLSWNNLSSYPVLKVVKDSYGKQAVALAQSITDSMKKEKNINLYIPPKLYLSLRTLTNLNYDDQTFNDLINEDRESAMRSHTLSTKEHGMFVFPLSLKNSLGEQLFASYKKASKDVKYDYYINYIGNSKEKPGELLMSQVKFDDFDTAIESLAKIAKDEPWCYHGSKDQFVILKIYLQYTYYRVVSQNKISSDKTGNYASFNTGLVNDEYDDIYCLLKNEKDGYHFIGFSTAGSESIGKMIVELFSPLPKKASYLSDPSMIYFDSESELHIDYLHILEDNLSRFPISFLKTIFSPFKELDQLLQRIIREKNNYMKENLFRVLENALRKNAIASNLLKSCFDGAVKKAWKIASDDFHYAIPSFFTTRNTLSLMLPLKFSENDDPEMVLLIEKFPSGSYQGQTILTLKQCYVNARLIAPTDYTFLDARKIQD